MPSRYTLTYDRLRRPQVDRSVLYCTACNCTSPRIEEVRKGFGGRVITKEIKPLAACLPACLVGLTYLQNLKFRIPKMNLRKYSLFHMNI